MKAHTRPVPDRIGCTRVSELLGRRAVSSRLCKTLSEVDVSRTSIIEHSFHPLTESCTELLNTHTDWREVAVCDGIRDKICDVAVLTCTQHTLGMAECNVEHVTQSSLWCCVSALLDRQSSNSAGRIGRTSISTCVDQRLHPRMPSSRDLSRCFPTATFWRVTCSLAELPADTRNYFSKCLTSPSPCLPMIPTASVHLRLHGVEMHSQFSSRAFPFLGLLCRQARSVQLCFSRTHFNDKSGLCSNRDADVEHNECFQLSHSFGCTCFLPNHCSLCTVNQLGLVCHANMIPVSKHPYTYLATRLDLWKLLTPGGMQWT